MRKFKICSFLLIFLLACNKKKVEPILVIEITETIPAFSQRTGNAEKGYNYLVYGDYIKSGIPYNLWLNFAGENKSNILNRSGDNAMIGAGSNSFITANNIKVVAPNCLSCHSATINGDFVIGLGNSSLDFTENQSSNLNILDLLIQNKYNANSPEYLAFQPYKNGLKALSPLSITNTVGVNPADKYAAILASHRNTKDLTWQQTDVFGISSEVIPTDIPAWWLLKKKNAMFYSAVGTGDFARIMMASSLIGLKDSTEARDIDKHFPDILAYINSLNPPIYKGIIDQPNADLGKIVYQNNCMRCHGSYTKNGSVFPNLLVSIESLGTDRELVKANFSNPKLLDWYNNSWFAKAPNVAKLTARNGYIAPPLDGIWATAPYLHNGSVPTLDDLLNSKQRPKIWKRPFNSDDYDFIKVGWKYTIPSSKTDNKTYDTTIKGYGNMGHTYGDQLSIMERSAVIEYLKTL